MMNQVTLLKVRIDQRVIVLLPECGDAEMFGEEGRGSSAASEPEPSHTDPAPQSDVTWPWCGDQPPSVTSPSLNMKMSCSG